MLPFSRTLLLALAAFPACAGGSMSVGPADAAADGTDEGCTQAEQPAIPAEPASCAAEPVRRCPASSGDGCLASPIQAAIQEVISDCRVYCGDGAVAFRNGCAAAVQMSRLGPVQGTTHEEALSCIRTHTIGRRWDCAPLEGWARLFLGSCTIP